jgi:hypothetical protein
VRVTVYTTANLFFSLHTSMALESSSMRSWFPHNFLVFVATKARRGTSGNEQRPGEQVIASSLAAVQRSWYFLTPHHQALVSHIATQGYTGIIL